jgi:hypothetical protein
VHISRFSLALSIALWGCTSEPLRPASAPQPALTSASKAPEPPRVESCRANPSTVYGDEPVVFELSGPKAEGRVQLQARDATGQSMAATTLEVPGVWQVPELPSGDFSLQVGASRVTCYVTVNRELSRASPGAR